MGKNTEIALIARGIDTDLAKSLSKKYTVTSLKQLKIEALLALGMSKPQAEQLMSEGRPPIPEAKLLKVLYKNRRTCCVCRDPKKSVIVHHISEWSVSRSHEENNLSVLCLEHHDEAHTKKNLSQNLTEAEIRKSKKRWEEDVSKLDAKSILRLKAGNDYARWDWINIQRVFELSTKMGLRPKKDALFHTLSAKGFIDDDGFLRPEEEWKRGAKFWFLDFGEGHAVAHYLSRIVETLLTELPIIDITPYIANKGQLKSLISTGDYIAAQLPFYFKTVEEKEKYTNQIRCAYYRGHSVRLEYTFNAWHCLSSSARWDGMSGRKVQTVFGFVRSILDDEGDLVISLSCLAAGTAFETHDARGDPSYSTPGQIIEF